MWLVKNTAGYFRFFRFTSTQNSYTDLLPVEPEEYVVENQLGLLNSTVRGNNFEILLACKLYSYSCSLVLENIKGKSNVQVCSYCPYSVYIIVFVHEIFEHSINLIAKFDFMAQVMSNMI